MQKSDVRKCLNDLSNKKCEGYDRIPVCLINDTKDMLLDPMASLFSKIYASGQIPEQWKVSKIIHDTTNRMGRSPSRMRQLAVLRVLS